MLKYYRTVWMTVVSLLYTIQKFTHFPKGDNVSTEGVMVIMSHIHAGAINRIVKIIIIKTHSNYYQTHSRRCLMESGHKKRLRSVLIEKVNKVLKEAEVEESSEDEEHLGAKVVSLYI